MTHTCATTPAPLLRDDDSAIPDNGPSHFPLGDMVITAFSQGLANLSGQLDRADAYARCEDRSLQKLLDSRLAPDMEPLSEQIALACHQAQDCLARMLSAPAPCVPLVDTPDMVRDAIDTALADLWDCDRRVFDAVSRRQLEVKFPYGPIILLTGLQYVRDWAVPQFYHHLVTAYAILRHQGVPLGNADRIAHMNRYRRTPL